MTATVGQIELDPLCEEIVAILNEQPVPTDVLCRETGHTASEVGAALHWLRSVRIVRMEYGPRGVHVLAVA